MADIAEFVIPVLLFVAYYLVAWLILRARGLDIGWGGTPRRVAAWRRLGKWQFVAARGVLLYTVPMSVLVLGWRYFDGKHMARILGPYYHPLHHPYIADAVGVSILFAGGIFVGLSAWDKVWDQKYDLA
jgi:hypothetical protein